MFASDIISKLEKEYGNTNKIKIAVRLVAMDKAAYQAVSIVNCTPYNTQPKMQNLLFSKQQNWLFAANPEKELQKIAKIAGINEERFQTCLTDKVFEDKFLTQQQEVHQQFTLNATPMIIINGKKLEEIPDYPHIEEAIERSLRRL
jgi:protein-disulfide isomerase